MNGGLTFLIVEDDSHAARVLARALGMFGHTEIVASRADARLALDATHFDALVVDVILPDGSGFDVLEDARRRSPEIDALVLSGGVDARRLAQAYTFEVTYLLKPASVEQLRHFATRVRARRLKSVAWLRSVIDAWVTRYRLTPAEEQVLALALGGRARTEIAEKRDVTLSTLKKQVQGLLGKTGDATLESAANRALRAALEGKS